VIWELESVKDTLLLRLSGFYSSLDLDSIPQEVIERAKERLIDFLGVLAVGFKRGEVASYVNKYVLSLGGKEESTILCLNRKVPAIHAALAMGAMAHSVELDDGHRWGTSHPGVAIIPSVLAFGEREGSDFKRMLGAIVVGYDLMLRVARAINPSHLRRGFHSTGTCGALGSAAACAFLKGFDALRTAYSVSIGGLQSAGIQEMLHDNPSIKVLQAGHAAMAGVLAADLVALGARGPRTLFEGKHGWLKAMCNGEYDERALIGDLGKRWEINFAYTKLYPTCRHCHASIDLAIEAKDTLGIQSLKEVKEVLIRTYSVGIAEVGNIACPSSFEEALFSLPFSVSVALMKGNVTLEDYSEESLRDEELKVFARDRVKIESDPDMDKLYPEERGAYMRVLTSDGRVFERKVSIPLGEPERPVDRDRLYKKLSSILEPYYPESFLKELWRVIMERRPEESSFEDIKEVYRRYCENG